MRSLTAGRIAAVAATLSIGMTASVKPDVSRPGREASPLELRQLIPAPQKAEQGNGSWRIPKQPLVRCDTSFHADLLLDIFEELGYQPKLADAGATVTVRKTGLAMAPAGDLRKEAYRLTIVDGEILLDAETAAGAFYGMQTLRQLLPAPGGPIGNASIVDWPAFRLRGFMHDVGRNFQSLDLLEKQVDIFSRYKLNTFHFHVTDNPGWRIESKLFPELQSDRAFSRGKGRFYTQEQFKQLVAFANKRHVTIIPELDVPGHSRALRAAFGVEKMDAPGMKEKIAKIIDEFCGLVPAGDMPYVHLGTDEAKSEERVPDEWLEAWSDIIRNKHGRKVVSWNPGIRYGTDEDKVQQMWTGGAKPWPGRPYIDSQNLYINHMDMFELLPVFAYRQLCPHPGDALGAVLCCWHDENVENEVDVIRMNGVYPAMLMFSDAAWHGRPASDAPYTANLPPRTSSLFRRAVELEERVVAQRDRSFASEPFPYLRQTDLEWRLIGPFDHKGDLGAVFPPETEGIREKYTVGGREYRWLDDPVPGATVYPRHFWYPTIFDEKQGTVYAFTRVWSPERQEVGAWIGFYAWSRSSGLKRGGPTPKLGQWSATRADVWVNGRAVQPPRWNRPDFKAEDDEPVFTDEDYHYREPSSIRLEKGWNTVLVKVPFGDTTWKWVFTFIPVRRASGLNAVEVPGLKFSADLAWAGGK